MDIGRRVYDGEISRYEAATEYGINDHTARDYMRLYRNANHLPPKGKTKQSSLIASKISEPTSMEELKNMSKDELILELLKARIAEARLKKGYEVKGDGSIIRYGSKNTK